MNSEDETVKRVKKINISRGEHDEETLDIETIEDKLLIDEYGEDVKFSELYRDNRKAIIFTRHVQCYTVKEYLEDLVKVPDSHWTNSECQPVLVIPCPHHLIKLLRKDCGFKYEIYADPSMTIYKELGFKPTKIDQSTPIGKSKHVKSGWLSGILKSTYRAMHFQDYTGTINQNGGCVVVGPGGVVLFSHRDMHMFDHCPINRILEVIGAPKVNFPKDPIAEVI